MKQTNQSSTGTAELFVRSTRIVEVRFTNYPTIVEGVDAPGAVAVADDGGEWRLSEREIAEALNRPAQQLPLPTDLHWLGDRESADATRHATDMRGCVMYFEQQSDCLQFMRWVEGLALPSTERTDG